MSFISLNLSIIKCKTNFVLTLVYALLNNTSKFLFVKIVYRETYALSSRSDYNTMLYLQHDHHSTNNWEGNDPRISCASLPHARLDEHISHYVCIAGFYGISHPASMNVDHALVTPLAKHWQQKIHTFHLGET